MSKNTTDELREQVGDIFARACKNNEYFGNDGWYELHTPTVRAELEALISNREKLLLDRVEKEILADDGTNTMFTEWNGMQIADLDMQKTKLATLRKELDGED